MKKKVKKKGESLLNILIPDHVKRTNDNSKWCGTVKILNKDKKKTQNILETLTSK